jgi:mono/diheme cytochrome c family protein
MSTQPPSGIRPDEFVTEFPFQITHDVLVRGQERYTVYCAICHDPIGTGNGQIIRRGFTKPPSYLADNSRQLARSGFQVPLREVPVGYLFDVATNGYGAMADYAEQVPPRDRWAIAAYIRTLQLSQNIRLDDLPPEIRNEAVKALEATP